MDSLRRSCSTGHPHCDYIIPENYKKARVLGFVAFTFISIASFDLLSLLDYNPIDDILINMGKISILFGKNMRRIRLSRDMSQGDVSRAIGMDRGYISGLENGKRNPTLKNVEKISDVLGVSVAELVKR